ncbi:MAG: enoyl-CoA hydratase [Solirubrobacteraceae bacterium]
MTHQATAVFLLRDTRNAIASITLNRAGERNALSLDLMRELIGELDSVASDPDVRAIVLRASGTAFSSGHNLRELIGRSEDEQRAIFDTCTQMMQTLQRVPQPVIAAVQGVAAAAGCQLVAACDLAVASTDATFLTPGVRIGLFCSTPMVALSRNIGRKRALEMLLTGEPIDAATASAWGLVNRVVSPALLDEETFALAERISAASSLTVRIGKQAFYRQIEIEQQQAYEYMSETMALNAVTCDAQEGMSAFLQKRSPVWQDR